ncbi:MAG: hypothetical protein Q8M25_12560 [Rhodoferax sp.]|nr:hypothetical protein [Rhodoferax sp.]
MNDTLAQRSLASVWHPSTQMKLHETAPLVTRFQEDRCNNKINRICDLVGHN